MAWRERLDRIASGDAAAIAANSSRWAEVGGTPAEMAHSNALWELDVEAGDFGEPGEVDRSTFLGVARGTVTPLLHYVDAWLAEGGAKGPLRPRTALQYRHDVGRLETWAKASGIPLTVEAFTKRIVGRYVTETIVAAKIDPGTGNRWVSAASAYWRWLGKRAGVELNPWTGASLAKTAGQASSKRPKRAFTDIELQTLLGGDPGLEIADLIRVAALSGMRLEEIYRLQVAHCADGWFQVREAKTRAGLRRVPIHSGLAAMVAGRLDGKAAPEFLFHEAGPAKAGRERSAAASKRFGRYRQTVGVHEKADGRRHSSVDFHSLRRWFITAARQHFDQPTVAAVVGHEAGNITDDVYSAGPHDVRRRAVVESVRLPMSQPR